MRTTLIALLALGVCLPLGCGKKSAEKQQGDATTEAKRKKTGVERDGYKGRVKSVKGSRFTIEEKFGQPVRTGGMKTTMKYDMKGNRVELVRYGDSGKIARNDTYKYDEKGNNVESVWSSFVMKKTTHKHTYKYDQQGNKVKRTFYESKTGFGDVGFGLNAAPPNRGKYLGIHLLGLTDENRPPTPLPPRLHGLCL